MLDISLRDFKLNKRTYALLLVALVVLAIAFFYQNYIKYGSNPGYTVIKSFNFNFLNLTLFILWVPVIRFVNHYILRFTIPIKIFIHGINSVVLITIYAFSLSLLLYLLGFVSEPFSRPFLIKYFLNIALLHWLFYIVILLIPTAAKTINAEKKTTNFIVVSLLNKRVHCKISELIWIEAMDHYVRLYTDKHAYLKKASIAKIHKKLSVHGEFIRIHRSYVINSAYLDRIERYQGSVYFVLSCGKKLKAGKTYLKTKELDQLLFTYL